MLEKIKYPSLNRLVSQKLKLLKEEDVDYIKKVQIWKFNHQWEFAYNNFKIYNEIKIKHHLPNFAFEQLKLCDNQNLLGD